MKKYYIAYGSNLNLKQMKMRCPAAKPVGQAMLENYKLIFNTHATIIKESGEKTPVGVFEITNDCEKHLDIYEGYPTYYHKEYIDIKLNDSIVNAMVYVMNFEGYAMPDSSYVGSIGKGYEDFDLDIEYLFTAIRDTAIRAYEESNKNNPIKDKEMTKHIEFAEIEKCPVVDGIKVKLPSAWCDNTFSRKTIPYERITYADKNEEEVDYFNLYLNNAIDGTKHSGKYLTRIDNELFLLLPIEAQNSEHLNDYVYLIGKGDFIQMRFSEPETFSDEFFEQVSTFMNLFD